MLHFPESDGSHTAGAYAAELFLETRSGRLAAWGNALLGGFAAPDDVAEAVRSDGRRDPRGGGGARGTSGRGGAGIADAVAAAFRPGGDASDGPRHVVRWDGDECGLTFALGRLRAEGVSGFRLALPVPGHPLGLTGPAEFNARAMEAGEAVLTVGGRRALGLVPFEEWHGAGDSAEDGVTVVVWECTEVRDAPPADVPTLREAERELAEALREATEVLTRLDLAGGGSGAPGPQVQAALRIYRGGPVSSADGTLLAPGYPGEAARVLERARKVAALVTIAQTTGTGVAVSASEMTARSAALRPLERAARRAVVAAHNAAAERRGGA